jgi:hypothetical protein
MIDEVFLGVRQGTSPRLGPSIPDRGARVQFAMGPIPRSWPTTAGELRLGMVVAASVSEWKRIHSLTRN